jgi:Domain of unknown function (DUF5666)
MKRRSLVFALACLLFAGMALKVHAHEGMIHVIGVVTALTDKSVTVETTDNKSVDVVLGNTTTYAKDKKGAAWSDLKVGDRVVIHAMKMNGALQAHTVEFSEAKQ